jgi:hypothetical protein
MGLHVVDFSHVTHRPDQFESAVLQCLKLGAAYSVQLGVCKCAFYRFILTEVGACCRKTH